MDSHTLHQSLQSSLYLKGTICADVKLICRAMLRELLFLAVIIALIICGVLIQLGR
jgi:hypothetical protein